MSATHSPPPTTEPRSETCVKAKQTKREDAPRKMRKSVELVEELEELLVLVELVELVACPTNENIFKRSSPPP